MIDSIGNERLTYRIGKFVLKTIDAVIIPNKLSELFVTSQKTAAKETITERDNYVVLCSEDDKPCLFLR